MNKLIAIILAAMLLGVGVSLGSTSWASAGPVPQRAVLAVRAGRAARFRAAPGLRGHFGRHDHFIFGRRHGFFPNRGFHRFPGFFPRRGFHRFRGFYPYRGWRFRYPYWQRFGYPYWQRYPYGWQRFGYPYGGWYGGPYSGWYRFPPSGGWYRFELPPGGHLPPQQSR